MLDFEIVIRKEIFPTLTKVCDVPNVGSVDMRPIPTVSRLIMVKEHKKGNDGSCRDHLSIRRSKREEIPT